MSTEPIVFQETTKITVSEDLIFEKLKKYISKNFEIPESDITKDKHIINNLGLDSMDLVETIMYFEEEFNTSVPDPIFEQISPYIGKMIVDLKEFLAYGKILNITEKRKLKLEEIQKQEFSEYLGGLGMSNEQREKL